MYILRSILWKLLSTRTLLERKIFFPPALLKPVSIRELSSYHVPSPSPKPHWVYYQVKCVADLRMWKKWLIFLSTVSTCPFFFFWSIAHSLPCCLPMGLRSIKTASLLGGLLWLDRPHFCWNAAFYVPSHWISGWELNSTCWLTGKTQSVSCPKFHIWVVTVKLPSCQNSSIKGTRLRTSAS